jgi:hypothetical protein
MTIAEAITELRSKVDIDWYLTPDAIAAFDLVQAPPAIVPSVPKTNLGK